MLYNTRQSSLSWTDENRTVNESEFKEEIGMIAERFRDVVHDVGFQQICTTLYRQMDSSSTIKYKQKNWKSYGKKRQQRKKNNKTGRKNRQKVETVEEVENIAVKPVLKMSSTE
ncbi:hypothetical protein OUZ56_021130 [Daphnia magna]|uniref:Uncharacterized protein n=1 Tax=Daphnia magna TaxID=35525 RepID=A0ABQ9ZGG7_9CRUS|nr:hypothetical protein OUZ56_021130 [Daphnia magna]